MERVSREPVDIAGKGTTVATTSVVLSIVLWITSSEAFICKCARQVNLKTGNLISEAKDTHTHTRMHTLKNYSSSPQGHGADIMENGSLFFTIITGIGRVSC